MRLVEGTKLSLLVLIALLSSCRSSAPSDPPKPAPPTPLVAKGISADAAKTAFGSPEALTKMLEERWPIEAIKVFCIPERRHNNMYQNLVAFSEVWRGNLFVNQATGFDEIEWYATTRDGRADKYSLGVRKGKDFWLLEINSEKSVQRAPEYSPDSKNPAFIGHK